MKLASLILRLDDPGNREKAEQSLVKSGFPEAENVQGIIDIVRKVQSGLNMALLVIVGILGIINSLILISIVGRSIADGQREIGVYRALGARRRDIAKLYIIFSTMQTVIGVSLGVIVGLLLVYPVSKLLVSLLTRMGLTPEAIMGPSPFGGVATPFIPSDFAHIDWQKIILYGLGLIVLTVIVSLIPAWRASRISPVEAIRQGE